jgi:hypothetical protein
VSLRAKRRNPRRFTSGRLRRRYAPRNDNLNFLSGRQFAAKQ